MHNVFLNIYDERKGCDDKPQRIPITELEKEIASPYHPLKYPKKADCSYILELYQYSVIVSMFEVKPSFKDLTIHKVNTCRSKCIRPNICSR